MTTAGPLIDEMTERLAYVMSTKESAVQQTLSLAEESIATLDNLKIVLQIQSSGKDQMGLELELFNEITQAMESVQERLLNILMVQGYQDLTGQVLQQVMQDMLRIDRDAQVAPDTTDKPSSAGFGPSILSADQPNAVGAQQDVDDLLAQMGL